MMDALYWLVTAASLVGVALNIRRHVACFWIWAMTNSSWALIDFSHGLPAQGVLQSIYVGLSIWGIIAWTRRDRLAPGDQADGTADSS